MKHAQHYHSPSPIFLALMAVLIFWLFGFKLLFFLPILFIFGAFRWGACGAHHWHRYDDGFDGKPKRKSKPKRDQYTIMDEDDNVTYL